jgi:hypothetical protein
VASPDPDPDPFDSAVPERRSHGASRTSSLQSKLLGIAAALLITVSFAWQIASDWNTPRSDQESFEPAEVLRLTSPLGPVRAWAGFHWTSPYLGRGWYTLEIWDRATPDAGPIVNLTRLTETEWVPADELPPTLRLRLRSFDANGTMTDEIEEQLSLTP